MLPISYFLHPQQGEVAECSPKCPVCEKNVIFTLVCAAVILIYLKTGDIVQQRRQTVKYDIEISTIGKLNQFSDVKGYGLWGSVGEKLFLYSSAFVISYILYK
jgi:hypothetical protein